MNQKDVTKVFVFVAKRKQENPREQLSISDIVKECEIEHSEVLDILYHLKEFGRIDFIGCIGGIAMDIHPTAEEWEYLWKKEDTLKRLLKGTKFEKLHEALSIAGEKIRGE